MLSICAPLAVNGKVKRCFADDIDHAMEYVTGHGGLRLTFILAAVQISCVFLRVPYPGLQSTLLYH